MALKRFEPVHVRSVDTPVPCPGCRTTIDLRDSQWHTWERLNDAEVRGVVSCPGCGEHVDIRVS